MVTIPCGKTSKCYASINVLPHYLSLGLKWGFGRGFGRGLDTKISPHYGASYGNIYVKLTGFYIGFSRFS